VGAHGFFQSHPIHCQSWTPSFKPFEAKISKAPVWNSLSKLPMEFYTITFLKQIRYYLGQFIRVDLQRERNQLKLARILILGDLSMPLKSGIWIGSLFQAVLWEDPPIYCSTCSSIGHLPKYCKEFPRNKDEGPNSNPDYRVMEALANPKSKSSEGEWKTVEKKKSTLRNKRKKEN
ncbi:Pleiotropic ABC efflux transporter of multiple drugs, partial [Bienertia sinuspersici]